MKILCFPKDSVINLSKTLDIKAADLSNIDDFSALVNGKIENFTSIDDAVLCEGEEHCFETLQKIGFDVILPIGFGDFKPIDSFKVSGFKEKEVILARLKELEKEQEIQKKSQVLKQQLEVLDNDIE